MKHIDYAIPAKGHPPMHIMHKFWARKPHNVVAEYIHNYSNPGDIVLDPFAGSGMTAAEALHLGRKAAALDVDPISTFITRCTLMPADIGKLKEAFSSIEQRCKPAVNELYETRCKCGRDATVIVSVWRLGDKYPSELRYECSSCGKGSKEPESNDKALIRKIEKMDIPFWHPEDRLAYGNVEYKEGTHIEGIDSVDKLFTKRNLYSLAMIYNEIEKIGDDSVRDLMKFAFTSMSHLASRMCPDRPSRPYSSFWAVHRYWIPENFMESNAWHLFESAVTGKQGLIKGKEDSQRWHDSKERYVIVGEDGTKGIVRASEADLERLVKECPVSEFKEAKNFSQLQKNATALIQTHSVFDLVNRQFPSKSFIPPESIDYCFTDPPYGGEIQYYELSQLWLSWLKGSKRDKRFDADWRNEITINAAQGKGFDEYDAAMHAAFRQVFEVMKPNKHLTVTFHNTDIKIRNSLIRSVVYAGFDLEKIVHQTPARASAKSLLQPYGSAVGDYYLRFKKPSSVKIRTPEEADKSTQERIVIDSVIKILAERGEPTSYPWILNTIDTELVNRGYNLLKNPRKIEDILKAHLGAEFVLVEVVNPKGQAEKRWWLKEPGKIAYLDRIPLNERVEVAVIDILRRRYVVTFDDVLREIFIKFPNSLTPETHGIRNMLEQYADQASGGRWQLKGSVKEREDQHQEMIEILAGLGNRFGFDKVWAAHKSKGIEGIIEKSLRLPMDKEKLGRVKDIDVLWINGDKVEYAFEVENTTAITEAINRGSNIDYECSRIIILPEERRNFAERKLREPMLAENWARYGWGFLFYDQVKEMARKRATTLNSLANAVKGLG
jgi:hypothetical protein